MAVFRARITGELCWAIGFRKDDEIHTFRKCFDRESEERFDDWVQNNYNEERWDDLKDDLGVPSAERNTEGFLKLLEADIKDSVGDAEEFMPAYRNMTLDYIRGTIVTDAWLYVLLTTSEKNPTQHYRRLIIRKIMHPTLFERETGAVSTIFNSILDPWRTDAPPKDDDLGGIGDDPEPIGVIIP